MNKLLLLLSVLMGVVVLSSNYLVQFPIKYYNLEEILTYGAFTYPIAFLITDLANRSYGKLVARKIVYIGFVIGIAFTLFFSTNFSELISVRIAIGSGVAFLVAQLFDVKIFDELRNNISKTDFLELENSQLRKLIEEQVQSPFNLVSARVMLDKQSPYLNSFVINVGGNKNIKNGMAVLDGDNFIGRIVDVNFFSSRVLLISDLNSKIPVINVK